MRRGGFILTRSRRSELCPLGDAEFVLLINDRQAELWKDDIILNHRLCADDEVNRTLLNLVDRLPAAGRCQRAGRADRRFLRLAQ